MKINLSFTSSVDGTSHFLTFEEFADYYKHCKDFFDVPATVSVYGEHIAINLLQPIYFGGENV